MTCSVYLRHVQNLCTMEDSLLELFKPVKDETEKKTELISCPTCFKYLGKTSLKQHLLIHTTKKNKKCQHCEKVFRQIGSLRRHEVQIHNIIDGDVKKYYKKYVKKGGVFPCQICGKQYTSKHALKIHNLSHAGGMTEQCDQCEKKFNYKDALKRHIESCHMKKEIIDSNLYKCSVCSKEVMGFMKLKQHRRCHRVKDKICGLCPYDLMCADHPVCYLYFTNRSV